LRIALAQINTTVGDLSGNRKRMEFFYKEADSAGADLIVYPELSLCGYPPEDLLYRKKFIADNAVELKKFSKAIGKCIAVVGVPVASEEHLYNSAAVISNGGVKALYQKILLPNYSVFDEKRYFSPGNSTLILECGTVKVGVTICEDLWHSDGPANSLLADGVDLIVNLSASPYYRAKIKEREKLFSNLCKGSGTALAYCNLVGCQDELIFDGGSFVINGEGKTVARAPQFSEELVIVDVRSAFVKKEQYGMRLHNTVKVKFPVAEKEKKSLSIRKCAPLIGSSAEIYGALVLSVRDYLRKNGFSKAILGVSGGIDSALVAAIACDALGKENVMGISMPTIYSSRGTKSDAKKLCENLGMNFREISIQPLFEAFKAVLKPDFKGLPENLAEENLQARLRANILMSYSNKFNYLLLSTGNKSEVSVGYSTLYGDMCGGYSPIKDLTKRMVYELSDYVNKVYEREIIPVSIIERAPSAELRHDQKDSDSLPEYPVLDAILEMHIEKHMGSDEIVKEGYKADVVKDIFRKVRLSEYKRRQAAPGAKITTLSFGKDRRVPITNGYRE
jgi:NAD+ synthase (glutamine-hydrolysing)